MRIFYQSILFIILYITSFAYASKQEIFLQADRIYYDVNDESVEAKGNVVVRAHNYEMITESLRYYPSKDLLVATDKTFITDGEDKNIYAGQIVISGDIKRGLIKKFAAEFEQDAIVAASSARRVSEQEFILENVDFTPCQTYCKQHPIWQVNARQAHINYGEERVYYRHSFFKIFGQSVLYIPYFSHPTPNAKSQSGLLKPELYNKDLLVPIYFTLAPNMDFTLTPRFSRHYTILGFEHRKKFLDGSYRIWGDFGNPSDSKLSDNQNIPQETLINKNGRFHLLATAEISRRPEYKFGLNVDMASDKSYLANYHNIYDPYLTSVIYGRYTNKRNYVSVETLAFQDFRIGDSNNKSFLTPLVNTQHTIPLDNTTFLNIRSNSFVYDSSKEKALIKSSAKIDLIHEFIKQGHIITWNIANRFDIYHDDYRKQETNRLSLISTPSVAMKWRYPLIRHNKGSILQLEPIVKISANKQLNSKSRRDHYKEVLSLSVNELSEHNIFHADKINIINSHNHGLQTAYGLNASMSIQDVFINAFLGHAYYEQYFDRRSYSEYVGNFNLSMNEYLNWSYRFRSDTKFRPIRNEIELAFNNNKIQSSIGFARLNNISKYFTNLNLLQFQDRISQISCQVNYNLTKQISLGGGFRANTSKRKTRLLTRNIHVSYTYDCVSMSFNLTDNFFRDDNRGIKKTRLPSFSLKLKVLNM